MNPSEIPADLREANDIAASVERNLIEMEFVVTSIISKIERQERTAFDLFRDEAP